MRRVFVAAVAALVVALNTVPAGAQIDANPKIAVHVQPHREGKGISFCTESPADSSGGGVLVPCSQFTTAAEVTAEMTEPLGVDLYIVIANGDTAGVGGATFGITYDDEVGSGIDLITDWSFCATGLDFPSSNWPLSGEGIVLTWDSQGGCGNTKISPNGVHATAGGMYVYAYSPDRFSITKHNVLVSGAKLTVADCFSAETQLDLTNAGYVDFGTSLFLGGGCNPCLVPCDNTPVKPTTWGRIKNTY